MVVWKKALFFGGAIVLLSACDQSVTAPTSLGRVESTAAAKTSSTTTTTTTTKRTTATSADLGPSCVGVIIRVGDTTCVPQEGQ
jgi:hypothetical protein